MTGTLNILLAGALGYIMFLGTKDTESPIVKINFPSDGYEFRTYKQIEVAAKDNKGVKSVTYFIDEKKYHTEDSKNLMKDVWNPCNLSKGKHTLRVEASDKKGNSASSDIIIFYISSELKSDCNGQCDGKAILDDCGDCSGGSTGLEFNSNRDCNGDCYGGAVVDKCQKCSGGNTGIAENADLDCTGTCFGDAFLDSCNICSGGSTQHEADSDIDCSGECFGEATVDECGVCSGGNTEIEPNKDLDCTGTCFGEAFLDSCNICSGGSTQHEADSDIDCNGECFGGASIDDCGVCSGGNTEIEPNKDLDCTGTCQGLAYLDDCDVCSGGTSNHIANSDIDCNGDCFGEAIVDECQVCSGGKTKRIVNSDMDCNSDCFGTAYLDDCDVCSEGNTSHEANSDIDCNGDCFGDAVTDPCGGCTGGNTGIEYNQSDVKFKNKSYTCGDLMFLIEMYRLKYPNNPCSSFDPTSNIIKDIDEISNCISEYLKIGETRWEKGRLTQYILSENNIKGKYPVGANYATQLKYLDISKNEFFGEFPKSLCDIHERGTLRIAGNKFCPPYPECFNNNAIITIDLEDMEKEAICD